MELRVQNRRLFAKRAPAHSIARFIPSTTMTVETCVCCFEEVSDITLVCSQGHFVCGECANMLVKSTASRLAETNDLETLAAAADDDLQYQGRLRCPCATASAGGCTAEYFSDATIAKVVDETTFEEYIGARALLPIARSTRIACQ